MAETLIGCFFRMQTMHAHAAADAMTGSVLMKCSFQHIFSDKSNCYDWHWLDLFVWFCIKPNDDFMLQLELPVWSVKHEGVTVVQLSSMFWIRGCENVCVFNTHHALRNIWWALHGLGVFVTTPLTQGMMVVLIRIVSHKVLDWHQVITTCPRATPLFLASARPGLRINSHPYMHSTWQWSVPVILCRRSHLLNGHMLYFRVCFSKTMQVRKHEYIHMMYLIPVPKGCCSSSYMYMLSAHIPKILTQLSFVIV